MQKSRSVPDVQAKRNTWIENISGANAEHQVYLDESGINTNLTRHYAHAVHGKRAIDAIIKQLSLYDAVVFKELTKKIITPCISVKYKNKENNEPYTICDLIVFEDFEKYPLIST